MYFTICPIQIVNNLAEGLNNRKFISYKYKTKISILILL